MKAQAQPWVLVRVTVPSPNGAIRTSPRRMVPAIALGGRNESAA
jgi:hypothetical protein